MKNRIHCLLALILIVGCKKPYYPNVIAAPDSYLVVEGMINSGSDSTIIKLNRTVKLSQGTNINAELNAKLNVEGDDNTSYALAEKASGVYIYPGLNLNTSHKYRLRIKTTNGKEYISDFEAVLNTPGIDSLAYHIQSDGVSVNVNTHDPKNSTRYYRWEYDETWVYNSVFHSFYKSNGDTVLFRDLVNDDVYTCWRTELATTIVLGSSAKLSQDVISDAPITFISRHSDKIRSKVSILVRQYGLSKDAYNFWENLKKNSQQLGSIFDAQPSQINGNIHSTTNKSEPVIGYVSVGTYTTKRFFIDERNLPPWIDILPNPAGCPKHGYSFVYTDPVSGLTVNQVDQYINFNKATFQIEIPIEGFYDRMTHKQLGYTASYPECVDCTLAHGTNKQPDFWK
ncbi:MAG: DUF4249 domain-containing protein [Mucilaginibacter sp.]